MRTGRGVIVRVNPKRFGFIKMYGTGELVWFGVAVSLDPDTQPMDLRVGTNVTFTVSTRGSRIAAFNVRLTNPDDRGWPPRNVTPLNKPLDPTVLM